MTDPEPSKPLIMHGLSESHCAPISDSAMHQPHFPNVSQQHRSMPPPGGAGGTFALARVAVCPGLQQRSVEGLHMPFGIDAMRTGTRCCTGPGCLQPDKVRIRMAQGLTTDSRGESRSRQSGQTENTAPLPPQGTSPGEFRTCEPDITAK